MRVPIAAPRPVFNFERVDASALCNDPHIPARDTSARNRHRQCRGWAESLGVPMHVQLLFGIGVAFGFIAWGVVTALYVWPELRLRSRIEALRPLLVLHGFRSAFADNARSGFPYLAAT